MKITIIGGGNMGGAIAKGLTKGSFIKASDITVADFSQACLDGLKAFNSEINVTKEAEESIPGADIILFAVKPWQLQGVMEGVKFKTDYAKQMIVSIAGGVSFESLNAYLKKEGFESGPKLFRLMPNTAIAISESMTFVSSYNVSSEEEKIILDLFGELGKALLIPEYQMDAATALGSCGTAFAMRYVRAASEGGVALGFYPDMAKEIVLQTVKGAVELLMNSGNHPEAEIDKVTTPGGSTIRGLNAMERSGFTTSIIEGLKASGGTH